jgi:two-component system chemotaxis response regulator CheB
MRTLVVDDSANFRTQIRRALDAIPGIEVVGSASNGRLALEMIRQKNVELLTLDLNMPEMNGHIQNTQILQ